MAPATKAVFNALKSLLYFFFHFTERVTHRVDFFIQCNLKDLFRQINEAASRMTVDSRSIDLSKKIFEIALDKKVDPMGHALSEVKKEIQQTF